MKKIVAAAIQINTTDDKNKNIAKVTHFIKRAANRGAHLVVLPELFNWRGKRGDIKRSSEPLPGYTSAIMAELAASLRIFILCGSIIETNPQSTKPFNTSFLVTSRGKISARYRKMHLFKLNRRGQAPIDESKMYAAGNEIITARTPFGKVGFSICYDLRFPELYRRLTRYGAKIIFVPSAFTFETGKGHWATLTRARAIENQVYIIAPNQHGRDPLGNRSYGHSMIVDPLGTVIAKCQNGDNIIYAELDPSYVTKVRRNLPVLKDSIII